MLIQTCVVYDSAMIVYDNFAYQDWIQTWMMIVYDIW